MQSLIRRSRTFLVVTWASPCSLIGLLIGVAVLARGGRARRVGRVIEFLARGSGEVTATRAARLPWSAITLGHVIIGSSGEELDRLRRHELVHVRQYEQWGPLFLLAYPLASVAAVLAGRSPYRGNWFERQAFRAERGSDEALPDTVSPQSGLSRPPS